MKRPKTLGQMKKELDRVFSIYIRATHPKVCYTCGASGKTLQCGHFVARNYTATRWDENNCRPQCVGCNMFGGGKPLDFEEHLIKDIGKRAVDKLKQKRHDIVRLTITDYEERIARYTL